MPVMIVLTVTLVNAFMYRHVLVAKDVINVPQRFIRNIFMKDEEVKLQLREYQKLRNYITGMNIPLRQKESLTWGIEREEKTLLDGISKAFSEQVLDDIRKETTENAGANGT